MALWVNLQSQRLLLSLAVLTLLPCHHEARRRSSIMNPLCEFAKYVAQYDHGIVDIYAKYCNEVDNDDFDMNEDEEFDERSMEEREDIGEYQESPRYASCVDKRRECATWAAQGHCKRSQKYMKRYCCKQCSRSCVDTTSQCVKWAAQGFCKRNKKYMAKYCCKQCTSCVDKSNKCALWASQGHCTRSQRYMTKNCCKQCTKRKTSIINSRQCGQQNFKRVVGGTEAKANSYPWIVQISSKRNPDKTHCGATLITDEWIVSAAHCFSGYHTALPDAYSVRLGLHTITDSQGKDFKIDRIILHPNFDKTSYDYDIALIHLSEPAKLSRNVKPACLPTSGKAPSVGKQCTVAGWGRMAHDKISSKVLLHVKVPIANSETCRQSYEQANHIFTNRMICAGYGAGGKDACQGDSGGPLTCTNANSKHVLTGIVSWGLVCGDSRHPGVYTNVAMFVPWIEQNTQ